MSLSPIKPATRPPVRPSQRGGRLRGAGDDAQHGELRTAAASAARWSFLAFVGQQGLRSLFALGLARIIGPHNYGVVALAMVFMTFTTILYSQGVGPTLVQRHELDDRAIGTAVWMTVGVALALGAITFGCAGGLAAAFDNSALKPVLEVLSISIVLEGLCVAPDHLLQRDLRMRALAIREWAAAIIAGALAIVAAIMGAGYWSLVIQILVNDAITLGVLVALVGKLPLRASWQTLKEISAFSTKVFFTQLLNFAIRNSDNLLVGRFLGSAQLAYYSISYRTMMLPIQALAGSSYRVTLPVYSRLQKDRERFHRGFLDVAETLAMVSFPMMAACIVAAPLGVELVLGPAWKPAVAPLQILSVSGAWQGVTSAFGAAFIAAARVGRALWFQVFNAVFTITCFSIGLHWGIVGVAAGFTIANLIASVVAVAMLRPILGLEPHDFVDVLVPPAGSCLALAGCWLLVERGVGDLVGSGWISLIVATLAGLAAYVLAYRVVWADQARKGIATIRLLASARAR